MGYYAYGDGTATLKENVDHELFECFLKYKVKKYTILEFDIYEDNEMTFNGEEKYKEENTIEFLNMLSPHITKGEIVYSGEDNSVWKFTFDPVSNEWIRQDAAIDFNFESYSDEQLIEEITKRGYEVKKNQ